MDTNYFRYKAFSIAVIYTTTENDTIWKGALSLSTVITIFLLVQFNAWMTPEIDINVFLRGLWIICWLKVITVYVPINMPQFVFIYIWFTIVFKCRFVHMYLNMPLFLCICLHCVSFFTVSTYVVFLSPCFDTLLCVHSCIQPSSLSCPSMLSLYPHR